MKKTEMARKLASKFLNRRYGYGYGWTWATNLDASGSEDFNEPDILSPGKDFIDGGAAWGFWSIRASPYYNRIVSFEPVPSVYHELSKNIRINQANNVTPIQMALSAQMGSQMFNDYGGLYSAQPELMGIRPRYSSHWVELMTVDKIVENKGLTPSLIKLDVEGAEVSVLEGAKMTLQKFKPKLLVEVHLPVTPELVENAVDGYSWETRWRHLNTDLYPSGKQPHMRGIPY